MVARKPIDESADLTIRRYRDSDQSAVSHLYSEGLLEGTIAPNDTGADIENIQEAYLSDDQADFWVAEHQGQVVGMIAVAPDEPNVAEIRRLRVDRSSTLKPQIASRLLETALAFCRHHGYLKVVLDTRVERGPAMDLFERFAFQPHRSRAVPGKELLEFYLDLYREPRQNDENH
jgi:ribosomal protein S18 acetylase RimI-like enzyme